MKRLDNIIEKENIQELSIDESKNTSGGFLGWLCLAFFVAGVIWGVAENPDIVE